MSAAPRFAIVLSGCGVYDGSEIHESVLTLLAISAQGGAVQCFAPDVAQHHVISHLAGEEAPGESRNVLVESARIARGDVRPLDAFDSKDFDVLVFPGGFGAAKNLSSFAFDGPDCAVDPAVEKAIRSAHAAGLPIGAWCIAPVVIARVLGDVTVTIGADAAVEKALEAMGATHRRAAATEAVTDEARRVVSTPCYMTDAPLADIAKGIEAAVASLISLARAA